MSDPKEERLKDADCHRRGPYDVLARICFSRYATVFLHFFVN